MNIPAKPVLAILLILLSVPDSVHTQSYFHRRSNRVIATDYNECLTGIKDTLGNWIVQPQYSDIRYASGGRFIVTIYDGVTRSGLIDSSGKVIFPLIFRRLDQSPVGNYYEGMLRGKKGVISVHGDTIVPFKYDRVVVKRDTSFWARKRYGKWIHYDAKGNSWKLSHRQSSSPTLVGNGMYLVVKGRWFLHSKSGILNDSGRTVVPVKYDAIEENGHAIFIQNNKKFGYLDSTGKQLWPMIYDALYRAREQSSYSSGWGYNFNSQDPLGYDSIAVVTSGGKCGIISGSGRQHLQMIYNNVYRDYNNRDLGIHLYRVKKDSAYGLYDPVRGWLLPLEYQHINVITVYFSGPDSIPVALLIEQKNNLYGVSTTTGQTILPAKYQHYDYTSGGFVFFNKDTITKLYTYTSFLKSAVIHSQENIPRDSVLHELEVPETPMTLPADGRFKKYTAKDGMILFYDPAHCNDTLKNNDKKYTARANNHVAEIPDSVLIASSIAVTSMAPKLKIGNDYILYVDSASGLKPTNVASSYLLLNQNNNYTTNIRELNEDSAYTYFESGSNMLIRSDGKILIPETNSYQNVRVLDYGKPRIQFLITDSRSRFAIMNYDGTFESEFQKGNLGIYTDQYMWIETGGVRGMHWSLFDRRTREEIPVPKGSGNNFINGHFMEYKPRKGGYALYNLRTQSNVAQNYNEINSLDRQGSMYEIVTCSGKIGVMDSAGRIILDTIYLNHVPLREKAFTPSYYSWAYFNTEYYSRYHSFYNSNSRVMLDVSTGKTVGDSAALEYVKRYMCVFDDTASFSTINETHREKNMISTTYFITRKSDSLKIQLWHSQIMADSLCAPNRYEITDWGDIRGNQRYNCAYCQKKTKRWSYITPSTRTREFLIRMNSDSIFSYHAITRYSASSWFSTVMLFKDGPRNMTLDSLFNPNTDWRNFVINSVITYVNTHLYVEGDCHNPAGFPVLLNQRFVLTNEGIVLYPEDFEEKYEELSILIPWSTAMPYLRDDVKTKIPVQKP